MHLYEFLHEPLALLQNNFFVNFFSVVLIKEKGLLRLKLRLQLIVVSSPFSGNPFVDGIFRPQLIVVSGLFGGNPFVDGIFRPQLIVVSGLFGGNPFVDGIFRPQLIVVSGLFGWNPFVDGIFRPQLIVVSGLFHNLAFFSRWNSCYEEAFFSRTFLF
jgi:hypothetical protein